MLCVSDLRFTIGEDVAKGLEEVIDKMTSLKAVHEAYAFYSSGIIARKARGNTKKSAENHQIKNLAAGPALRADRNPRFPKKSAENHQKKNLAADPQRRRYVGGRF